jgi:hypothetical protein
VTSNLGQAPSDGNPKWYNLYLDPDVTGAGDDMIVMTFDIMSFDWNDDYNSWLWLEEVELYEVTITTGSEVIRYDFTSSAEGWAFAGAIPPFDEPMTAAGGTSLGLMADGSRNCFSYWLSPDVVIADGVVYRARFEVGSLATDPDQTVQFRLRTNQKGSWQTWTKAVVSALGQAPGIGANKTYGVIMDPNVTGSGDDNVVFSFDIMSFDWNDDADAWIFLESLVLNEVVVEQ